MFLLLILNKLLPPKTTSLPVGIYLLKANNRNNRTRCEICSKLTIRTPERRQAFRRRKALVICIHSLFSFSSVLAKAARLLFIPILFVLIEHELP